MQPSSKTTLASTLFEKLASSLDLSRGRSGKSISAMEGLRGVAVVMVFLVHYAVFVEPWIVGADYGPAVLQALIINFNAGVDLFFIMSGYLIYGMLIGKKTDYGVYAGRRLRRIYPTFFAVFLLYVLIFLAMPSQSKLPAGIGEAATFLLINAALLPGMLPMEPMISVAWSLSFEVFFYLTVPFTIPLFRPLKPRNRIMLLYAASAVLLALSYLNDNHQWVRAVMFFSGMILYEQVKAGTRGLLSGTAAVLVAAIASLLLFAMPDSNGSYITRIVILFVVYRWLCLACFTAKDGTASTLFNHYPLRWLGNMSYSFYLIHNISVKVFFLILAKLIAPTGNQPLVFIGAFIPCFVFALIVSYLLFLCVEKPLSLAPAHPLQSPEEGKRVGESASATAE